MMICSVLLLFGCCIFVLTQQQTMIGVLALALPVILFLFGTIYLEILCYKAASALNQGDEYDLPESLRNQTLQLQFSGWILLGLPLLLLLFVVIMPIGFVLVLLAFVTIGSILNFISVNKRADESELLWLLAVCVEKDIPIPAELDTYSKTLSRKYRKKVQHLSSLLHSGASLSEALSATPRVLPQSAIIATRIGEESNSLGVALRDAAIQNTKYLKNETDKSSLPNLLLYLAFVVSIQFLIVSFIMYYIIPKFKKIFLDFGVELPPMTLALTNTSDYVMNHFYLFSPLFSLPFLAVGLIYFGNYYGWYNLRMSFITGWFPRLNTPQCLRQIAQSILVDKPPQIALNSVSNFHLWTDVRVRTKSINNRVNQGENIWDSLQKGKVITSAEASLCAAAERMGNLPCVLRNLADTIEQRRARRLRYFSEILKPILICLLGILVGFIVIALFLPLIKLINGFS